MTTKKKFKIEGPRLRILDEIRLRSSKDFEEMPHSPLSDSKPLPLTIHFEGEQTCCNVDVSCYELPQERLINGFIKIDYSKEPVKVNFGGRILFLKSKSFEKLIGIDDLTGKIINGYLEIKKGTKPGHKSEFSEGLCTIEVPK